MIEIEAMSVHDAAKAVIANSEELIKRWAEAQPARHEEDAAYADAVVRAEDARNADYQAEDALAAVMREWITAHDGPPGAAQTEAQAVIDAAYIAANDAFRYARSTSVAANHIKRDAYNKTIIGEIEHEIEKALYHRWQLSRIRADE